MNTRQLKRWCTDCKLMVFALNHEHLDRREGTSVSPFEAGAETNSADAGRAWHLAKEHLADVAIRAKAESEKMFVERLTSAVDK